MVDELALYGLVVLLVANQSALVELRAVLLDYVLLLFGGVHALQSAA